MHRQILLGLLEVTVESYWCLQFSYPPIKIWKQDILFMVPEKELIQGCWQAQELFFSSQKKTCEPLPIETDLMCNFCLKSKQQFKNNFGNYRTLNNLTFSCLSKIKYIIQNCFLLNIMHLNMIRNTSNVHICNA